MKLFNIFKRKKTESQNQLTEEEINAILDNEIQNFFPESGWWGRSCFQQPFNYSKSYLPCHTRDFYWMSKLLEITIAEKGILIPQKKIQNFLENSPTFNKLRHDYELKIVSWQIDYMNNGGSGWLIPDGFDDLSLLISQDVDEMFRGGIVITLEKINLPLEIIEEGIEKYADQWRDRYIKIGYSNEYEPCIPFKGTPPVTDSSHKNNWIKLKLYQYYQNHKSSVDKYGVVTPEMQMSEKEVQELRKKLFIQNEKRKAFISEWDSYTPANEKTSQKDNPKDFEYDF